MLSKKEKRKLVDTAKICAIIICTVFITIFVMDKIESARAISADVTETPDGFTYYGKFYTVKSGDSYWSIASDLRIEYPAMQILDTRALTSYIEESNNLHHQLKAGECILVPCWIESSYKPTTESGLYANLVEYRR